MSNSDLHLEILAIDPEQLRANPQSVMQYIDNVNYNKLQEYILDNLNNLDGGPSISNLEVQNFNYNSENRNGTFRLKFQIDRRYCCSDTESCASDYLDFDFKVDEDRIVATAAYFDWSLNN